MCRLVTVALFAFLGCYPDQRIVQAVLSTPKPSDNTGARAAGIAALRAAIQNEPRTISIGDQEFPFYNGPVPRPGSLAEKIRLVEAAALAGNQTQLPKLVAQTAWSQVNQGKVTSMDSIVSIYDLVTDQLPKPMSTDISDPTFGQERLTTKAMKLRQVRRDEYRETVFELTDAQVSTLCGRGVTWRNIRQLKALYVEDYHDAAQWNDASAPEKYVPNVVGFFCYNAITCQFVPIEIQYPDTGLSYTPFDSKDEWTLAKIGLNAASVVFHQWAHYSDTHAMSSSIRVELFRNMAAEHPIRALVEHHQYIDHGIELLVMTVLLAPKTPIDLVFGWGGKGSARFVHSYLHTRSSLKNDLPTDLQTRGLNDIPRHKYAQYGSKLYNAIDSFVKRYIDVYYKSDYTVKNDFELQNWARDCALVPHLKDFPSSFTTKMQLQKLVTHLLYLSGVKHHAMNSAVVWAAVSTPYSNGGLRKAMPTRKGEKINLMEYGVPLSLLPTAMGTAATYVRPVSKIQSWTGSYDVAPFNQEAALKDVLADFLASLATIDKFIAKQESGEKWPFDQLRPTSLPYFTWI